MAQAWNLASLSSRDGSAPCSGEQTAHVVGGAACWQLVEHRMGERGVAGKLTQNRLDMGLADPCKAAVGAVHGREGVDGVCEHFH